MSFQANAFQQTAFQQAQITLARLLAASTREEIILCELEPSCTLLGFAAAGGGLTNTYAVSLPRLVQTDYVVGGIYANTIRVTENGVALTQQTSAANVDAGAGRWCWDEAAGLLYVRPTAGAPGSYTMLATRRLYFASSPLVLELTAGSPATAVYYHPWITGDLPRVRREVEDLLSGGTTFPSGSVSFTNGHGAWFTLVAPDGRWNWKNTLARFYLGGRYNGLTLAREEYGAVATMITEDVAPTETTCAFALQPLRRLTELELPVTPFFEAAYPNLGDGVRGTKKWIGYGRATMVPDLTDTATSQGVYTVADAAYQTLFAIHNVWAVRKDTGAWTLLAETTHYTQDLTACTVTVTSAMYPPADYTLAIEVTGKPDGLGSYLQTYGEIVRDMLATFLGIATADIDAAGFAATDLEADAELSLWVKSPRSLASIFATMEPEYPSLGRSVMGTVQQTAEGLWTARIWDPSLDSVTTTLRREDLARFDPKPKLRMVFSAVRVHYGFDHARQQWSVAEVTDPTVQYKTGSRDRLDLFTFLVSASNAETIAERYMLLAGAVTVEAEFAERGALLAQVNAGDKVYVTYTPAPSAGGDYVAQPFEVLSLEVAYAPKVTVTGILGDLRGLGGRVGRWMGSGAPDWSTATPAERQASGFWTDSAGLADSGDAASGNRSIWW